MTLVKLVGLADVWINPTAIVALSEDDSKTIVHLEGGLQYTTRERAQDFVDRLARAVSR